MGYTLKEIVSEYLIEIGETQENKFARCYQYGLSFLRRANFNTTGFPKVVELTMNSNDTADLPADYLRYTRIALCLEGRLYCLGLDDTLCLNKSYNDCGVPQGHSQNSDLNNNLLGVPLFAGTMMADNFTNGEFMGRLFGIGGDNNCFGYYRIDQTTNQIQFGNLSTDATIILEYLADVSAVNGDFPVHPFAIEALKDWIQWKYKERSSRPLGEQAMARENFNNSNRLMRMMFMNSTKEEWVAAFASGNMAAPKM